MLKLRNLAVLVAVLGAVLHAQTPTMPTPGAPTPAPPTSNQPIVNRLIVVGPPKVYDDFYLRNQLDALRSQLERVSGVDQKILLSHVGVAQGADLRQSSVALSASGPSTPGVQSFSLAPGTPAFSYPPGYTTADSTITAYPTGTATATTPGTQTTVSSMVPSAPTAPSPSLTVPTISSLGQSSLDTYNESLQLSAEITNTALLLNGATSDAVQSDGKPKTSVTVGFPVTIEPPSGSDHDLAYAVAEIQVTVCSNSTGEPPSIVTLLPRERTYNVASLVDKSFLGSASAILGGFANVGGSFLWGHKTYYLVQQQETVAFLRQSPGCGGLQSASFAWQIHPVLGKKFIRPGNSVNFVQFAIPQEITSATTALIGTACVAVVWHRSDSKGEYLKTQAADGDEAGRLGPISNCFKLYYYNGLRPVTNVDVVDIGSGLVNVTVGGTFLPGTKVRLGSQYAAPDTITATRDSLTFTAPAATIVVADGAELVGRDNRQLPIINNSSAVKGKLSIGEPTIEPYSDTQSLVVIDYKLPSAAEAGDEGASSIDSARNPWVVVIGGKVFGLSDAPFLSSTLPDDSGEVRLVVPNSVLQVSPNIGMRRLLWPNSCCWDYKPIPRNSYSKGIPSISKASILSSRQGLTIGLLGSGLDHVNLVIPDPNASNCINCSLVRMGSTFIVVTLPKPEQPKTSGKARTKKNNEAPADPTDGLKQLVFCRMADNGSCSAQYPRLVVDVPKLDTPAAKPKLEDPDPVPTRAAQLSISGSMLDQVVLIEYGKMPLDFRLSSGQPSALILDISKIPTTVPGGYQCLVTFADKSTAPLTVHIKKAD